MFASISPNHVNWFEKYTVDDFIIDSYSSKIVLDSLYEKYKTDKEYNGKVILENLKVSKPCIYFMKELANKIKYYELSDIVTILLNYGIRREINEFNSIFVRYINLRIYSIRSLEIDITFNYHMINWNECRYYYALPHSALFYKPNTFPITIAFEESKEYFVFDIINKIIIFLMLLFRN